MRQTHGTNIMEAEALMFVKNGTIRLNHSEIGRTRTVMLKDIPFIE